MVGRIIELDHVSTFPRSPVSLADQIIQANLSYTIRRESGVLDIVDDRHVAGSEPTF
jgi:hypothetical protein